MRRATLPKRLVLGAACAVSVASVSVASASGARADSFWHELGRASYYANAWIGHRTSSGARFDQNKLTAAHASLPLGTRLLVTCESTGESVVVTVNDRQPDHGSRIIDLSRAAASRLHMIDAGVADVVIATATPRDIQAEAALDNENADEVADAPDEAADQEVAMPAVSHARHGRPHRRHVRR